MSDGPCDKENEDCDGVVSYEADPYELELYGSLFLVRVCRFHYRELKDSI